MIVPADHSSIVASQGPSQYVPATQLDQAGQNSPTFSRTSIRRSTNTRAPIPCSSDSIYAYKANEGPFNIQSIYHDDKFTYIKTSAPEKFSVYEMQDGKPNLITYDLREGTYIIPKVMDSGCLELGKKRMEFTRKG